MIPRLLLVAAVVLATHPAIACPPQFQTQCNVHHAVPVRKVVKQQVVQHHAAQQVYGHGYAQQQAIYQPYYYTVGYELREQAAVEKVVREAQRELRQHFRQLAAEALKEAVGQINGPAPTPDGFVHPGIALAQQKCAQCHTEGSAKVDAGVPALFNGLGEFTGTAAQAQRSIEEIDSGRMPKDGPELSHSDFVKLQDYLAGFAQ